MNVVRLGRPSAAAGKDHNLRVKTLQRKDKLAAYGSGSEAMPVVKFGESCLAVGTKKGPRQAPCDQHERLLQRISTVSAGVPKLSSVAFERCR